MKKTLILFVVGLAGLLLAAWHFLYREFIGYPSRRL